MSVTPTHPQTKNKNSSKLSDIRCTMVFVPSIISNSVMGFNPTVAQRYLTSKRNYDGVSTWRKSIYQRWNNSVVFKSKAEMSLPPELDTNRGLSVDTKLSLSLVHLAGYTEKKTILWWLEEHNLAPPAIISKYVLFFIPLEKQVCLLDGMSSVTSCLCCTCRLLSTTELPACHASHTSSKNDWSSLTSWK